MTTQTERTACLTNRRALVEELERIAKLARDSVLMRYKAIALGGDLAKGEEITENAIAALDAGIAVLKGRGR